MKKVSYDILMLIIGVILTLTIPAIISWAKQIPFWAVFKFIFGYPVPLWIVLLILLAWYLTRKIKFSKAEPKPEPFLKYTQDRIDGIVWKWTYAPNQNGQARWKVSNLRPTCTKCGTYSNYDYDTLYYHFKATCPRCENVMAPIKEMTDVETIIIDNIHRGQYTITV